MMQDLRDHQAAMGAVWNIEDTGTTVPLSFGNDAVAIQAAHSGVAVCDRSHWGLIQVSGADRIRYLHNQSTNNFYQYQAGMGCETVFVTSTARTLDLITAYFLEDSVLLFTSPHRRHKLLDWMDRYIFPADQVELLDLTEIYAKFSLIGPDSAALLERLGLDPLRDQAQGTHRLCQVGGAAVHLAGGSGLATGGYTLWTAVEQAAHLWSLLTESGAVPLGDRVWEQLRIQEGRPAPDHELTEEYNPLEAGLWHTISFSKGCYIGQETIARLDTYKGVKQRLWGIRLSAIAPVESPVVLEGEKVGKLTSVVETADGVVGLAYVRTKAGGAGLRVQVGDSSTGELVEVPFLTHERQ